MTKKYVLYSPAMDRYMTKRYRHFDRAPEWSENLNEAMIFTYKSEKSADTALAYLRSMQPPNGKNIRFCEIEVVLK